MAADAPIRNHVTFQTSRFNQTEVKPHFINECCFGEDCAAWLVSQLRQAGFPEIAEPWHEDWGWQTSGARPPRKYLLSVGLIPEETPEWLVFFEESVGFLANLTGGAGPAIGPDLAKAIHEALSASAEIRAVRWHLEHDFKSGQSQGTPTPTSP